MKLGAIGLGFVALAMLSAPPAFAQEDYQPSRLNPVRAAAKIYNRMSDGDRARMAMLEFGECTVRTNRPGAQKILNLFPDSPEYNRQIDRTMDDQCLRGEGMSGTDLRSSSRSIRGVLYHAFYLDRFRRKAPPLSPSMLDLSAETAGQDAGQVQLHVALRRFGECVVRTGPEQSRAIVLAPIGSPTEAAAFKSLNPILSGCIQPDQTISLSKAVLSGIIAEVLYRLSTPPALAGKS